MKRMILTLLILMMLIPGTVFAVQLCIDFTAAKDAQITRQSTRQGVTKEVFGRQSILNTLDYNRAMRWEELRFANYSAICTDNNSCD